MDIVVNELQHFLVGAGFALICGGEVFAARETRHFFHHLEDFLSFRFGRRRRRRRNVFGLCFFVGHRRGRFNRFIGFYRVVHKIHVVRFEDGLVGHFLNHWRRRRRRRRRSFRAARHFHFNIHIAQIERSIRDVAAAFIGGQVEGSDEDDQNSHQRDAEKHAAPAEHIHFRILFLNIPSAGVAGCIVCVGKSAGCR